MVQVRLTLLFDTIWQIYDKIAQNGSCGLILSRKNFTHYVKSVNLTFWVSEPCRSLI
jgi:hypothetical protein